MRHFIAGFSKIKEGFYTFLFMVFPLFSFYFFRFSAINVETLKLGYFLLFFISLFCLLRRLCSTFEKHQYSALIRTLLILMAISIFVSYLFWDQEIDLGARSTAPYMAIIYYFVLLEKNPTRKQIERLIFIYSMIYLLCWLYGMYRVPELVFGLDGEDGIDDKRGVFRLTIPGRGILLLFFFFSVAKYAYERRIKWLIIMILVFTVIIFHVVRQVIAISFFIAIIFLIKDSKRFLLFSFLALSISVFFVNIKIDEESVVGNLIALSERQVEQSQGGEENIRVGEYRYFAFEYNENWLPVLIGNGVPHSESGFGKRELRMNRNFQYYASDVGYAEIFIRFGLIGVLVYLIIFFRVIFQKVSSSAVFAKLFIIYLMIANLTASWVFHDAIFLCISLYILERDFVKKRKEEMIQIKFKKYL